MSTSVTCKTSAAATSTSKSDIINLTTDEESLSSCTPESVNQNRGKVAMAQKLLNSSSDMENARDLSVDVLIKINENLVDIYKVLKDIKEGIDKLNTVDD